MHATDRLDVRAEPRALETVRQWVEDCSVRHDLPESIVGPLNLILEELVANVMEHGKTPEGGVVPIPIHIEMDVTDAFVELRVADASAPFDPRDRDDPDLSGELARFMTDIADGRRIAQPKLRYRFQTDRVGLVRSRFRLVGKAGGGLGFELEERCTPTQAVLGALYATARFDLPSRLGVMATLRRALR